jgi:hypothetical protein
MKQRLNVGKVQIFMFFRYFSDVGNNYSKEFVALAVFAFSGFEETLQDFGFFCGAETSELIDEVLGLGHYDVGEGR